MKKFLFIPLNNILDKRKNLLEQQYAEANLTKSNAIKLKDQYEDALKTTNDLSKQIIEETKAQAKIEYANIIRSANEEAGKIIANAHKNIEAQHSKELLRMKGEIANLAMETATKIIGANVTPQSNKIIYERFLTEAGELDVTKGSR
jgi:F-type H+-transporting ATPase subunit b